jgi:ectoine hydroxylase-related dioxygenase (phytanoyl-CoA dioxygenase family)
LAALTQTGEILSQEQRAAYERDGILMIEDPCSADLLEAVMADVDPLYRDDSHPGPNLTTEEGVIFGMAPGNEETGYHWHRIKGAWKTLPSVRGMALAPNVLRIVEEVFGRKALPFQTLNFPVGTEQDPHSDAMYFNSDPPGYMCGVWIALEDLDMDNGPLVYYPGSHKLPQPSWTRVEEETGLPLERSNYATYEEFMGARNQQYVTYTQQLIEQRGLEPAYGTIKKGQALLWAPNLLHGGAPQKDKSRTRHSQVTHYFFEGCRQYMPMRVEGDHVYWDYPEWVRDPPVLDTVDAIHAAIDANVPDGVTLGIASDGYEGLLELDGRDALPFPQAEDGTPVFHRDIDDDPVHYLELLKDKGARYIVFPKKFLWWLEFAAPELQAYLENRCRAVLRDGSVCVIWALD